MGSIFINAGLAAGVALAAVPVIMHLFMKQTPKHVVFPALRLIRERQKRSRKTLRIKNWLLLLARMALLALMALALARPRMDAKVKAGAQEVETALALVFDTSLSMSYSEHEKSRLNEAKERAQEILQRAHAGSEVFVIDSADAGTPPALSPASARKRVESLKIRAANRPLNQAIGLAYSAVSPSDKPEHDVYVLTDLSRSSWNTDQKVEGLEKADKVKGGVATFVLKIGAEDPHDVAIVQAEPTSGLASENEPVPITARLRAVGLPAERVVEYYVDGQKKDQKIVKVPANGEVDAPAFSPRLPAGLHRVRIALTGEPDPLPFDDSYYLTFDVQASMKVLLISDLNVDALFVEQALDPIALRDQPDAPRPFQVERMLSASLPPSGFSKPLSDYACVFLLDVETLEPAHWHALADYVKQGGGLMIGVGSRVAANVENYNQGEAAEILPAKLGAVKVHQDFSFGRADVSNTLFARYTDALLSDLGRVPIYKTLDASPATDSHTILYYQNDEPALIERLIRSGSAPGRVLLWTTSLSRLPETSASWSEFPIGDYWSFYYLMNQSVLYLTGTSARKLVVEAGESVTLPLDPNVQYTEFHAQPPGDSDPIRLNAPTGGGPLLVPSMTMVGPGRDPTGQWTVSASKASGKAASLGFSVNPPPAETQLDVLSSADLDAVFGKDKYELAGDSKELKEKVTIRHVGREIYPYIMLLILLLVTLENTLANMFYKERAPSTSPVPARA